MRRLISLAVLVTLLASCGGSTAAGSDRPVRILSGEPSTLDPAGQGDAGSAAITAQLFESLTSFDADLQVRPALAESWTFADGGRQVTFKLRPDLTFSDGSPLRPSDVARSWLRIVDPKQPSPLASLAFDIVGAEAYMRGTSPDPASVGLHADDAAGTLTVDLTRPATDFVNIVAGPEFGVVPPSVSANPTAALAPGKDFVASGGYVLSGKTDTGLELTANPRYWAGKPAITTIDLVGDLGGRGAVDAFTAGDIDYAPVPGIDASWLAYDETLGPQLRQVDSLSVQYYGFDTHEGAVRRPARPAGLRAGDRLAADGGPERIGRHRPGRELDGPAGDPGPERPGFPPALRPGERAGAPGQGRLSRWRGLPDDDPDDRWLGL